jgi:hypothetical protein
LDKKLTKPASEKKTKLPKDNCKNSSSEDERVNQNDEALDDQTFFEFNSIEIKKRITRVMFVVF